MRVQIWILLAAITTVMAQEPAPKQPGRYALVVTNEKYSPLQGLTESSTEGDMVEKALSEAGFKVKRIKDFKQGEFYSKDETPFLNQIQPGDTCVFYYSGYTAKVDFDDSYLLPVDFNPNDSSNMEDRAVHLSRLPEDFDEKKAGLKIIVVEPKQLDASIRRATPGLIDPSLEGMQTLFAFAWPPERAGGAYPSAGAGLFTKSLIDQMAKPGRSVAGVFEAVKNAVGEETKGVQLPYIKQNLFAMEFLFHEKLPEPVSDGIQPGIPYSNRKDRQEYVWIPPGHFNMGCVPSDAKCDKDEKPRHPVTISKGFWMGQTEVTVNAYIDHYATDVKLKNLPTKPTYGYKNSEQPIVLITWAQANDFCKWAGGRLPTEAEWEYAARGNVDGEINGLGDNAREKANFFGREGNDKFDTAAPVKQFDQNGFKLYDMLGNVWEWVRDTYDPLYYSVVAKSPNVADPRGPAGPEGKDQPEGKDHVTRGGSYDSLPDKQLRLSIRKAYGRGENNVGMRCVLDESPETRKLLGR